mmetsp:Transcript_16670/g.20573  ORF Transcript_16670/g.20573 Transcript_16670/m.20573 type:complete len:122 (+) Transcript_16670:167-532(+)
MSSWFGGGSSSNTDETSSSSSWDSGSSFESPGDFASAPSNSSSAMRGSQASLQQAIMEEQQKQQIQAAIMKISELAFEKCVSRPSESLSSSEKSCISNTTERYLDCSMFVTGRIIKQQQQR